LKHIFWYLRILYLWFCWINILKRKKWQEKKEKSRPLWDSEYIYVLFFIIMLFLSHFRRFLRKKQTNKNRIIFRHTSIQMIWTLHIFLILITNEMIIDKGFNLIFLTPIWNPSGDRIPIFRIRKFCNKYLMFFFSRGSGYSILSFLRFYIVPSKEKKGIG
jgi:hypothetical protein